MILEYTGFLEIKSNLKINKQNKNLSHIYLTLKLLKNLFKGGFKDASLQWIYSIFI